MIAATPEAPATDELPETVGAASTPPPAPVAYAPAEVIAALRTTACRIDPAHCHLYREMDTDRMHQAIRVSTLLMQRHLTYRRHFRPGRGRREHAAEMHRLVDAVNVVDLTMGVAWALAVGLMFPPEHGG
jgi:hypothetical protein